MVVAEDLIGYDQLMQDALRSVVRQALHQGQGARGLPGRHHFYISFHTHAPGVAIPEHLSARYPDEMTIVLEHQYWDLEVYQDRFRVILKFGGQPHPITIPFAAITRFYDPSVKFGLQFEASVEGARRAAGDESSYVEPSSRSHPVPPLEADDDGEGAAVVSLDAFRKK
jgi:hypothetical protein